MAKIRQAFRKPYRVKRKKSIFRSRFFWVSILTLIIIFGFFYLFIFSSAFQIKKIEITGNQKVKTKDLQKIVSSQIEKNLLFFSTKSIFLINLDEIKENILNSYLQIAESNLKYKFPNRIKIEIEERKPVANFCHQQNCFFLDKEGIIFERVFEIKTNGELENLKIKSLIFEGNLKLGENVIEKEKLNQILKIQFSLLENELEISLTEALIVTENRINLKTSQGWEVYFNPNRNLDQQIAKLKLILEEEIPLEDRLYLDYIDLRFEKVYYKYRE